MSGHSKWSTIKRAKGAADARRGQMFTKLAKEIMLAVRDGGPSPEQNYRLRLVMQKCKDANMPSENIERAIRRASGESGGAAMVEATFEGYASGGVAVLVQVVTDNRNRTLQDIRNIFSRGNGSMAEAGAVAWMFEAKGVVTVEAAGSEAEDIALSAIDAGAEDVKIESGFLEVYTTPDSLESVRESLEHLGAAISSAEVSMLPNTTLQLDEEDARRVLKLLDRLEEMDDVQKVYSNVDFSEEVLARLQAQA